MAAPPPPADMGGARQFLADPETTCLSTMVGDMAALNLQLIHALGNAIPAAARGVVDNITARSRLVLAASNISQAREQATRELRPITRVPAAAWGIIANIANIRMHNVPTFSGSGADTLDVVRWVSRIFTLAEANNLSFAATINLLIQGSSGGAADYIEQMRDEQKTLSQIVQQLEMRYGDLCTPEEARVKTNNMVRKEDEGLPEFIDRLRAAARMACRMENDDNARRQGIDILVEGNIRRVLPASVRNALEERVINRSRMGLPAFTAREIEKECLDLERRRDERKSQNSTPGAKKHHGNVHVVEQLPTTAGLHEDTDSSADEADVQDEGLYHLIREVKQVQHRYAQKGKKVEPQKVFRKAFRQFNNRQPQGARLVGQGGNAAGN